MIDYNKIQLNYITVTLYLFSKTLHYKTKFISLLFNNNMTTI